MFVSINGSAHFSFPPTSLNPSGNGAAVDTLTWTIGSKYKLVNTRLRFDLEYRFDLDRRIRRNLREAQRAPRMISIGCFSKHLVQ